MSDTDVIQRSRQMVTKIATTDLVDEIRRRFRVRFGRIELTFHDGQPTPRVLIEHRYRKSLDEMDD